MCQKCVAHHQSLVFCNFAHTFAACRIGLDWQLLFKPVFILWFDSKKAVAKVCVEPIVNKVSKQRQNHPERQEATCKQRMTWGPPLLKKETVDDPAIVPEHSDTPGSDPSCSCASFNWVAAKTLQGDSWREQGSWAISTSTTGTKEVSKTATTSWSHNSAESVASLASAQSSSLLWLTVRLDRPEEPKLLPVSSCVVFFSEPLHRGLMQTL